MTKRRKTVFWSPNIHVDPLDGLHTTTKNRFNNLAIIPVVLWEVWQKTTPLFCMENQCF